MITHAHSKESLRDTLNRVSWELEAQLLGPLASVATIPSVPLSLTNIHRKLWDLDFGQFWTLLQGRG